MQIGLKEMMRRVGQPARLILFSTLTVAAGAVALAMLVFSADAPGAGIAGDPVAGSVSNAVSVGDDDTPQHRPGETMSGATLDIEDTEDSDDVDDGEDAAVAEACQQLRSGTTVADFAIWFEATWREVDEDLEDAFRAVIERALTEACPDVLPSD